ncbi:MAG: hypothetical protein JXO72_04305 [Vicinamibacteria bacterium]|nr:hypothetical protein [Vicinamibacteria bacterium]
MRFLERLSLSALALLALSTLTAQADVIHLKNGRTIAVDRAWKEGFEVRYEKNGGVFGIPASLVERIAATERTPEKQADSVLAARRRLDAGDPLGAIQALEAIVKRDPRSITALQALAEAKMVVGDARSAEQNAKLALRLDDRNARSHALLGDAALALGNTAEAIRSFKRSLELKADDNVARRLAHISSTGVGSAPVARLRVRYDGSVNEPLGTAVLAALDAAYDEFRDRLGTVPTEPVTVVLQTSSEFHEDARAPEWAAGLNDGSIRAPVGGLSAPTPALLRVLRHELAHSFVNAGTRGNCPTWLHEGIAQWLEGRDPAQDVPLLKAAVREQRLISLAALEAPFRRLSAGDATLAYAESLSAVAYILRARGDAGIVRLLAALGDGLPSEEALVVALALSYPELQSGWEQSLKQ